MGDDMSNVIEFTTIIPTFQIAYSDIQILQLSDPLYLGRIY
jgi:hypothetical protein